MTKEQEQAIQILQKEYSWFVHSEEYRNAVLHFNHAMRLLKDNAPTIVGADKAESEARNE